MNATRQLQDLGQSLWLDNITRGILDDGTLERYISELSVTGLTSNPSIFDHAIKDDDWGIDSFDQWGVELGKALAQRIGGELQGSGPPAEGHDSSTTTLMRRYLQSRNGSAR